MAPGTASRTVSSNPTEPACRGRFPRMPRHGRCGTDFSRATLGGLSRQKFQKPAQKAACIGADAEFRRVPCELLWADIDTDERLHSGHRPGAIHVVVGLAKLRADRQDHICIFYQIAYRLQRRTCRHGQRMLVQQASRIGGQNHRSIEALRQRPQHDIGSACSAAGYDDRRTSGLYQVRCGLQRVRFRHRQIDRRWRPDRLRIDDFGNIQGDFDMCRSRTGR